MRKTLFGIILLTLTILLSGCAMYRLSEEEYSERAINSYRQGKYSDAWGYYRLLIAYYPNSSKIDQYREQLCETLLKLSKTSKEPFKSGYLNEIQILNIGSDTLLAWLDFQSAMDIDDPAEAKKVFEEITLEQYLLAAQYSLNRMNFSDAILAYDKALDIHSKNPDCYKAAFLAGFVCQEHLKDNERAEKYYRIVVDNYPNSDLADDAAWTLKNMGKSIDEIEFLNITDEPNPNL